MAIGTVPGIAESWNDISLFIERRVDCSCDHFYSGIVAMDPLDSRL
jgi:hypothetical protein